MNEEKVICFHHRGDLDGYGSAAIVKLKYPDAEFVACEYSDDLFEQLPNGYDKVFICDFSMSIGHMLYLKDMNKQVIWIDHHAKTIREIESEIELDGFRDTENNHSACILTWRYLFPDREPPFVLKLIEDVDIWKWEYNITDEVYLYLDTFHRKDIDYLVELLKSSETDEALSVMDMYHKGTIIVDFREKLIEKAISRGKNIQWEGYDTYIVNATDFTSYVGNAILDEMPDVDIALIWRVIGGKIIVSLRSRDGEPDVAKIAAKYDGGGHDAAAGFHMKLNEFTHVFRKLKDKMDVVDFFSML